MKKWGNWKIVSEKRTFSPIVAHFCRILNYLGFWGVVVGWGDHKFKAHKSLRTSTKWQLHKGVDDDGNRNATAENAMPSELAAQHALCLLQIDLSRNCKRQQGMWLVCETPSPTGTPQTPKN
eukprot:6082854-Amphidinium_carterae.1